jgi:hypothetical protein
MPATYEQKTAPKHSITICTEACYCFSLMVKVTVLAVVDDETPDHCRYHDTQRGSE